MLYAPSGRSEQFEKLNVGVNRKTEHALIYEYIRINADVVVFSLENEKCEFLVTTTPVSTTITSPTPPLPPSLLVLLCVDIPFAHTPNKSLHSEYPES